MSAHGSGYSSYSGPPEVLPASQYLQERLQEQRRAKNTRPKRERHTDIGLQRGRDDDIFLDEAAQSPRHIGAFTSSPITAVTPIARADSNSRRRTLGVRDMDDQMDRLTKENFALKLELDHRRAHNVKLQEQIEAMKAQVERAEELEHDHHELLKNASSMIAELERRDKAIEEATNMICDLEDRIAYLSPKSTNTRPSTAQADSGYAGTETNEAPSPPRQVDVQYTTTRPGPCQPSAEPSNASEKLQDVLDTFTPAKPRREPGVFSQKKASTSALRSVYLENAKELHAVKSFQSMLSRQGTRTEDDDVEAILHSPRLSTLSESSLMSMYQPVKQHRSPNQYAWEADVEDGPASPLGPRSHLRQDSMKRVSQWIEDREVVSGTPSKSNGVSTPVPDDEHQQKPYRSSDQAVAAATAQSLSERQTSSEMKLFEASLRRPKHFAKQPRPTSFAGPIFGEPLLPPTPDSVSTRMLRASRSSVAADEGSLLPETSKTVRTGHRPTGSNTGVRTAPRVMRSSVELSSAYTSNLQYRNGIYDGHEADEDCGSGHFAGAHPDLMHHANLEYNGYPDGGSIVMGTPSRFLKHAKPPVGDMLNNGNEGPTPIQTSPRRRRSSDQFMGNSVKPRLDRAETSPVVGDSMSAMVSGSARSTAETMISPRSAHSASSGNRTIVQPDDQGHGARSTEPARSSSRMAASMSSPGRSRMSPSPGRTLSQKTAGIFRRVSSSAGGDYDKSSLPTLTTTPSSAYAHDSHNELRRPKTSHTTDRPLTSSGSTPVERSPSKPRRPSVQQRTKTEPGKGRPASAATEGPTPSSDKEKRGLFSRSGSAKKTTEAVEERGGQTKRRGSLRDAVSTARRPWR